MKYQHKELSDGRWFQLSFMEQIANIGSEVERAIAWRDKKKEYSILAIERALELLHLTINDERNRKLTRLKELTRLREALIDYFFLDNEYQSSDILWQKYFRAFAFAIRKNK